MALVAFAGNSLICRLALAEQTIDATSFTVLRVISGAAMLSTLVLFSRLKTRRALSKSTPQGSWAGAIALFLYATAFSYAYIELNTGMGALILFSSVQITMILVSIVKGNRLSSLEWLGFIIAMSGFVYLVLPGINAPSILGSVLMILSGVAWGIYSLVGAKSTDALADTSANFRRASVLSLILLPVLVINASFSIEGAFYAALSGAVTSGLGYAIWYRVLPQLRANVAAVSQLSVPVLATLGGWIVLSETLSLSFMIASGVIISGIAMVIFARSAS
ncbi:DMT family transporter [Aliiglaciecola sp. M165]|uniref:DMT family transporter n=1 Tax=Aliiglaciecola sp. M165 TaxID=2593649 RepID=UPI00117D442A|nr:DMT family transporter [Aliiglaciecola sp. M165]TRY32100.1 DMT family transporter [Aliiglaciecola sp. M165]